MKDLVNDQFYSEVGKKFMIFLGNELPNDKTVNYAEIGLNIVLAYLTLYNVHVQNNGDKGLTAKECTKLAINVMNFIGEELMKKNMAYSTAFDPKEHR